MNLILFLAHSLLVVFAVLASLRMGRTAHFIDSGIISPGSKGARRRHHHSF